MSVSGDSFSFERHLFFVFDLGKYFPRNFSFSFHFAFGVFSDSLYSHLFDRLYLVVQKVHSPVNFSLHDLGRQKLLQLI